MAGLLGAIQIKGELYQVEDVADITETGIYNLRASVGVYVCY